MPINTTKQGGQAALAANERAHAELQHWKLM